MARNFSGLLNDAFAIDNSNLDGLAKSVKQKCVPYSLMIQPDSADRNRKQAVSSQNAELEALEAKLRETEERLKERTSRAPSPSGQVGGSTNSPHRRKPLGNTFNGQERDGLQSSSGGSPLATQAPSGPVSASTMSQWRPSAPEMPTRGSENTRDLSAEQLSGQQGRRFS